MSLPRCVQSLLHARCRAVLITSRSDYQILLHSPSSPLKEEGHLIV